MSQALSLPLHIQKAVVGRLLGLQALAPQMPGLQSRGFEEAGMRLHDRLCRLTNEELDAPISEEQLCSFLAGLVGKLRAEAADFRSPAARDAVAPIIEEFAELVKAFCEGSYDPLEILIRAVAQTATDFYGAYTKAVPSVLWKHTSAKLSFNGGKTGLSFAPDVFLQATTTFGVNELPSGTVLFKVAPRWLDEGTIATIPRLLLHEYIAHVPQGPYFEARMHPDANDAFAEGWMDYVAHYIHRSAMKQSGPSQALAECLIAPWMDLYDVAADHFFVARRKLREGDPAAAARCDGAATAFQFHNLLGRLPESKNDPDTHFYRMSFGINASRLSNTSRGRIVYIIRRCQLSASRSDILIQPLREWAVGSITLLDFFDRLTAGDSRVT